MSWASHSAPRTLQLWEHGLIAATMNVTCCTLIGWTGAEACLLIQSLTRLCVREVSVTHTEHTHHSDAKITVFFHIFLSSMIWVSSNHTWNSLRRHRKSIDAFNLPVVKLVAWINNNTYKVQNLQEKAVVCLCDFLGISAFPLTPGFLPCQQVSPYQGLWRAECSSVMGNSLDMVKLEKL